MFKKFWKKKSTKIWAISSLAMAAVSVAVPLVLNLALSDLLDLAFGAPAPVFKDGEQAQYVTSYADRKQASAHANEVNQQLNEEGMVLLKNKNNALPIAKGSKVSVFGKNSVDIAIGGSGSGAAKGDSVSIDDSLKEAGFETNQVLKDFYKSSASGTGRSSNPGDLDSGKPVFLETGETPQSSYTEKVKSSYQEYSDLALVVFTRIGGEGFDLPMSMEGAKGARKADDHFLQLDQNETDLLKAVCEAGFKKVVVVLNSGSPMELGFLEKSDYYAYQEKIDAAIWMGYPGNSGTYALGRILSGEVNPSGRTVDTFSVDFKKDPSFNNMSVNRSFGSTTGDQYLGGEKGDLFYFTDYEEGEYVGYRYYETRGETDGEDWYRQNVVYPFGYGLSYTTFDWSVKNKADIPSTLSEDEFTIQVDVKNTGNVSGKDVVEVYATLPYTPGEIEKPSEILVGFAKTKLLDPGEKEILDITVNPYYMASYDNKDRNHNGFKGFELDKGSYSFRISRNAHEVVDRLDMNLPENIQFSEDPVTGTTVGNLFTDNENPLLDSDYDLHSELSRNNWEGTWPTSPTVEDRTATKELFDALKDKSTNNPTDFDNDYDYPLLNENNGYSLYDLLYKDNLDEDGNFIYDENGDKVRGEWVGHVDYDDPRWEAFLDQMDFNQVLTSYNFASYKIGDIESLGLPSILCADGPVGWTSFVNPKPYEGCCSYCCGVTIAATWNEELVEEFGKAVGDEGIIGYEGTPFSGWYAPGMNIHRSPFGGRCFEYYSEDAFLSGKIGAAEARGTASKGVVSYVKHFALNEQETHRSISGDCSWVSEQVMREIYLRPFEITVKEGKTMGIMSSFNRIGTRWTGGDYRLITTILRDEWGFEGSVICDFNTIPSYMDPKQEAYAGGDLNLATMASSSWNADEGSIGDNMVLRRIAKNICYSMVNSNAMQGTVIGVGPKRWQWISYTIIGVLIGAIIIWGGALLAVYLVSEKKKPEDIGKKE